MKFGYARPFGTVTTQRAIAGIAATAMLGGIAGPAAVAGAHTHTTAKTYVLSKKTQKVGSRTVTITVFTRAGKKYRAKEWFTGSGSTRVKHRYVYLMKGKAKTTAQGTPTAATTRACTDAESGAIQSAYDAFYKHLQAGHLETSPENQVKDIVSDPDGYAKIHTVLVENMMGQSVLDAGTLPLVASEVLDVFMKHVNAGHLETSPEGQVKDIIDIDQYTKTHTVLVENMMAPLLAWERTFTAGSDPVCTEEATPAPAAAAPTAPAAAPANTDVMISGYKFPAKTAIATGGKVTWTNMDDAPHTVSSMHGTELKSGNFTKGQTFSHVFTKPGVYMYVCDVHPDMKGEVDVS